MLKKIKNFFIILTISSITSNTHCFLQMPEIETKKIEIKNINIEKTKTTARISWITTEESNCRTSIDSTTFHTKGKVHSTTVSGLNPGTHYIFYIEAENKDSDIYMEGDYHEGSFITDNAESISIREISTVDSSSTHITMKWKTDTIANCYIEYGESSLYGNIKNSTSSDLIVHEVTLTELIGNKTYHYKIHAENIGIGWLSSETTERTFFIYGDAVVISNETSTVNLADVTITCNTDLESNCRVEYSTDSSFSNYNYHDMNTSDYLSHSVTMEDLQSGVYYYRIRAIPNKSIYSNGFSDNFFFLIDVTDSEIVELEDASNIENGKGSFGDPANVLCKEYSVPLLEGIDFEYDSPLNSETYNIWDNGIAGTFSTNKYIRIVENGKNIADITGLNLTPIVKNLTTDIFPPPSNQCYIDPIRGKFMLPRPAYWSRMESIDNITSAEINNNSNPSSYAIYKDGSYNIVKLSITQGKFSNCIRAYLSTDDMGQETKFYIYPYGQSLQTPEKGTLSVWLKTTNIGNDTVDFLFFGELVGSHPLCIHISTQYYEGIWYSNSTIKIGGEYKEWESTGMKPYPNNWNHVYIVWDRDKNMSEGRSVRLWINGSNKLNSQDSIPSFVGSNLKIFLRLFCMYRSSYGYIDNLKVWNHIVSEAPAWIYRNGDGMENALHFIYGAENGYRPKLSGEDSGVGYFRAQ